MSRFPPLWLLSIGCLFPIGAVTAQTVFQAPTGAGDTWNVYEVFFSEVTFKTANAAASGLVDPIGGTEPGHLATIASALENGIVHLLANHRNTWIGLTDREGAAPGAQEALTLSDPLTQGWAWANGESLGFFNWSAGEPNNSGGFEDAVHLRSQDGLWNDQSSGYGLDEPIAPTLQPGTSPAESEPVYYYVVEYDLQSPVPFPGVRRARILSEPGSLPGPAGGSGYLGVREVRGLDLWTENNIFDAVTQALSGNGTFTDGQISTSDVADPETNPDGGPNVVASAPVPFLTDTPGSADNDILSIVKGFIRITDPGDYSFQVRSDDGFALRLPGHAWSAASRYGRIDPSDPETLFYRNGTTDSNTFGVIQLPTGVHSLEFVTWDGKGGAYYEITTARGAIVNQAGGQWLALGDTRTIPEISFGESVALDGAATLHYLAAVAPPPPAIDTVRGTMDAAILTTDPGLVTVSIPELYMEAADMPNGGGNDYMLRVDGSIVVDDGDATAGEVIALSFILRTNDGSSLRIIGQDFTGVAGDSDAALMNVAGDTVLTADYPTGNANAIGHISLPEGIYAFQAYMFQSGGSSRFEIQSAPGLLTAFNGTAFGVLDSMNDSVFISENTGLPLVNPLPEDFRITHVAYDVSADEITLTWRSVPGRTYSIFYSDDLSDFSTTDVIDNVLSQGISTTRVFPNPQPAAVEKRYFVVKEND